MTTYNYSAITNGQSINFSVAGGDVLHFDTMLLGAFNLNFNPEGANILFTIRDNFGVVQKTFTLQNVNAYQMSSSMITFLNGSTFKLGDNSSATGDDAATASLQGTAQGDMLITAGGGQLVEGLGGDDNLATVGTMGGSQAGGTGADTLDGGDGSDWLSLAGEFDAQKYTLTLNGSSDANLAILNADQTPVTNASAIVRNIENVEGSEVIDVITGDANANKVYGNAGNDTLSGGDGNDTLNGGSGADSLIGGNGTDTVDYSEDSDQNGVDGFGVAVSIGGTQSGTWAGVNYSVTVGANGAATDGWGNTDDLGAVGTMENVIGSAYNDVIFGNNGANNLNGGQGSDLLVGGGNNDTLDGGSTGANSFFDWVSYSGANGSVNVNLGSHQMVQGTATNAGTDTLQNIDGVIGSSSDDTLVGGDSTNQRFNGEKFEWLEGRGGNDSIDGGRGTTAAMNEATREYNFARYTSATGSVTVNLSTGTASDGLSGTDTLVGINGVIGSNQADTLTGGNSAFDLIELFEGGGGDDSIDGGIGFDMVMYRGATSAVTVNLSTTSATSASTGTDTLSNIEGVIGSDYNDTMIGGSAAENFQGRKGADNIDGGGGVDQVDYHGDENGLARRGLQRGRKQRPGRLGQYRHAQQHREHPWFDLQRRTDRRRQRQHDHGRQRQRQDRWRGGHRRCSLQRREGHLHSHRSRQRCVDSAGRRWRDRYPYQHRNPAILGSKPEPGWRWHCLYLFDDHQRPIHQLFPGCRRHRQFRYAVG
ncbi:MAG: hypothetical protein HZB40_13135 [Rhodocyclales bacterium]|nr:hypothetical protein [Rhodocyclales bacterium]